MYWSFAEARDFARDLNLKSVIEWKKYCKGELEGYDKKPINLKTFNMLISYPGPKYKKVSFSNPGHAINLAKKLNKQFDTDQFTVVVLDKGKQIYP